MSQQESPQRRARREPAAAKAGIDRRALLALTVAATAAPADIPGAAGAPLATPIARSAFPILDHRAYLDSAHRTAVGRHVDTACAHWLGDQYATAGVTEFSPVSVERTRAAMAKLLGVEPQALAMTQGCTHGLNLALDAIGLVQSDEIALPNGEYVGLEAMAHGLQQRGVRVRRLAVGADGQWRAPDLEAVLRARPKVFLFSWVRNDTGARADLEAVGEACRRHGVLSVCDAMQATGFLTQGWRATPVDVVATGLHKGLLGVPGVGALWIEPALCERMAPGQVGKGSFDGQGAFQPGARRFEYGNPNHLGLAVAEASANLLAAAGLEAVGRHIQVASSHLLEGFAAQGWRILTPRIADARAHIVSLQVGGEASRISAALSAHRVSVSRQGDRLRFSVGAYTDQADLDHALGVMGTLRAPGLPA